MSSFLGQKGEDIAASFLKQHGFKLLHRNFSTPRYEIDIIAKRKKQLYFIEVKYRSNVKQGKGYEYVTPAKINQMVYAAQSWVAQQQYGGPYQLAVVSVDGDTVTLFDDIWQ